MSTVIRMALALTDFVKSRAFALSLFSVLSALIVYKVTDSINVVTINDGGNITTAYTMSDSPEEILESSGVVTLAYDAVDVESLGGKLTEIEVNRAFPAYVEADGKSRKVMVTGGTVAELLSKAMVELGDHDEVNMPLDAVIKDGDVVVVTRKEYVTVENTRTLPFDTVYTYSPDVMPGEEKVLVEGEEGKRVQVLRQLLVDGEVANETVKSDETLKEPVTEEVLMGFPMKPVSPLDFECDFDEDCEPLEYVDVFRSQKSAGYSAPKGASTASGRKAIVGNVAVDPRVIPYGTKMFIKATDDSHIYGYAVAADTGTALVNGLITVDLLYATYEESASNGLRKVDIFILEWGK